MDPGGYGISWNEDLDMSEYELWTKGIEIKNIRMAGEIPAFLFDLFCMERIIENS